MPGWCALKEVMCYHRLFPVMTRTLKCWFSSTIMPIESAEVRLSYRCWIRWIFLDGVGYGRVRKPRAGARRVRWPQAATGGSGQRVMRPVAPGRGGRRATRVAASGSDRKLWDASRTARSLPSWPEAAARDERPEALGRVAHCPEPPVVA